jgi:ferredoxin-NADP reductase/DMSO/TMAO reductase YedYZ heme-binding membrane subunit
MTAQHSEAGDGGAQVLAGAAGIGLIVTAGLAVGSESRSALGAPGEALIALGRLSGLLAAYAMLLLVLLVARLPPLERVVGHPRLVYWHRRIAPWPLVLVAAHGVFITAGYAQQAHSGLLRELWVLLTTYPGVLAGTVGFLMLVAAGVTSYRRARARLAYETWWAVHLYTYLALGLAFSHQVATGAPFVGHTLARAWWTALWLGGAGAVIAYRVVAPLARSLRHRLKVAEVTSDAPGVVSVVLEGRALDRLGALGGQFVQLRVLKRGLWWQAHPYSVSAMPTRDRLRVTLRADGDYGAALARAKPGTRVAIEGPYGAFTKHALSSRRVLLAGAGVGITPLRALLEDLPRGTDVIVLARASSERDLVLRDELRELVGRRGGHLHELVGTREDVPLHSGELRRLVPDLPSRDVYVCGPDGFTDAIRTATRAGGVPRERIHDEAFAF